MFNNINNFISYSLNNFGRKRKKNLTTKKKSIVLTVEHHHYLSFNLLPVI